VWECVKSVSVQETYERHGKYHPSFSHVVHSFLNRWFSLSLSLSLFLWCHPRESKRKQVKERELKQRIKEKQGFESLTRAREVIELSHPRRRRTIYGWGSLVRGFVWRSAVIRVCERVRPVAESRVQSWIIAFIKNRSPDAASLTRAKG